jgi:hypothetical protein
MGRFISDASPINCESNACADNRPVNRRMAVPALPMSSARPASRRPRRPTPRITTRVGSGCSMCTPKARIAAKVARQSSLARNPLTSLLPCAMPDSISARCEMDLSPGTVIAPDTLRAGCAANCVPRRHPDQSTARGYEPSTLNKEARSSSAASALATGGSLT